MTRDNVELIIGYGRQKRASIRRQRYYYRGLKGTPFSLGLALPDGYGHFRVVAETEVKRVLADHNINGNYLVNGSFTNSIRKCGH